MPKKAENQKVEPETSTAEEFFEGTTSTEKTSEETPKQTGPSLEERYKASSEEGIRLSKENKTLKESLEKMEDLLKNYKFYDPYIERLATDKSFAEATLKLAKGKPLEKDEEFDFDETEDPNSASFKKLESLIERRAREIVRDEFGQFTQAEKQQRLKDGLRNAYLRKHPDRDESYLEELEKKAKSIAWDYEMLDAIVNRDVERENIDKSVRDDIKHQMEIVRSIPKTLAGAGADSKEPSPEAKMFSRIKKFVDDGIV